MSQDDRPAGTAFPGFVILLAIAALIVTLVSVRQQPQAVRVWVPASMRNVDEICAPRCRSIDPALSDRASGAKGAF